MADYLRNYYLDAPQGHFNMRFIKRWQGFSPINLMEKCASRVGRGAPQVGQNDVKMIGMPCVCSTSLQGVRADR